MSDALNTVDTFLQAAATRLLPSPRAAIILDSTTTIFHINTSSVADPTSITFNARFIDMEGTVTFSSSGATLTSISGNTCVLLASNMSGATATVTASMTYRGVAFSSTVNLSKVVDGAAGAPGTNGLTVISRGVTLSGSTLTKTGGTSSGWDADAYSKEGYVSGAYVSGTTTSLCEIVLGLSVTPSTGTSYADIDYAIRTTATGDLQYYTVAGFGASGVIGTYSVGDIIGVSYDGTNVRWLKNGVALRTQAFANTNPLYMDCSFFTASTTLSNVKFFPFGSVDGAAALVALANIASDNILSPGEKPAVVLDYTNITNEQAGIDAQATAYGITTEKTTYDTAVSALTTYLGTLSGWNTIPGSDVTIVGTTFRTKFSDVYTARQALLNAIDAKSGTVSTWAGTTGDGKPMNYATVGPADAATSMGFNPQFNDWPTGQTYPTGWIAWSGSAPAKETTTIRTAPYAVKYTVGATDMGATANSYFASNPLGTGVFIKGSYDVYVVNNAGGTGKPGYMFRLYTNSGLTTYRNTFVPAIRNDVTGWQRVPFTAQVNAGEQIYGIDVYQMASYSGMPGGSWSSGSICVFDNLTFEVVTPTDTSQINYSTFSVSMSGSLSTVVSNGYHSYGTKTTTVTGGTSPFTYQWTADGIEDDNDVAIFFINGSTTSSSAQIRGSATDMWIYGSITVTVTDATGRTAVAVDGGTFKHGTYSPP